VLFAGGRETLRDAHGKLATFLEVALHLTLKHRATLLAPARVGLPFLGFRIQRGTVRVRPESLRRMRRRIRRRQFEQGLIDQEVLQLVCRQSLGSNDQFAVFHRQVDQSGLTARRSPAVASRRCRGWHVARARREESDGRVHRLVSHQVRSPQRLGSRRA